MRFNLGVMWKQALPHAFEPWCYVEESQLSLSGFGQFKLGKLGAMTVCLKMAV
jgi:hypothetical protein